MAETEDDFVVVIVGDDVVNSDNSPVKIKEEAVIKEEFLDLSAEELINVAKEYGMHVKLENIKEERLDYDYEQSDTTIIEESAHNQSDCDDDYVPDDEIEDSDDDNEEECSGVIRKHRYNYNKPHESKSLVSELIKKNPKFKKDQNALIDKLVEIMRNVRRPNLPNDYCSKDLGFQCSKCGVMSETEPAASRHYQEKHGKRYLKCMACGADFRSTTNLYKHEKRCIAPDAIVMLKARAMVLGRKGRSRPFLRHDLPTTISSIRTNTAPNKYYCDQCSGVFLSKVALQSHLYHHKGMRPFQCAECPNAYTSATALMRHKKKHTDIQYICDHCGRSFKLKATLTAHLDTHAPLKKFACTECDKRYAQKCALQLHVNREHLRLPPPCACRLCPRRYPRMSLLKTHMEKAHDLILITRKMFFKSVPSMPNIELGKAKVFLNSELTEPTDYLIMRPDDK